VYAIIEAANRGGGVFRSTDAGSSWRKMSSYTAGPPFYYHRLFPDPREVERFYSIDVVMQVTADSGRTFTGLNTRRVHVDYHVMWVDPDNTSHLITGNDGGLYESHDRGATWRYSANLPLTQFYKVAVDSAKPFYHILGGTQDNNTIAGPSRTTSNRGLANADWYIVVGGDGFQPRVDPVNPDIVYGQFQHGELNRLDRKTGERVNIQPQATRTTRRSAGTGTRPSSSLPIRRPGSTSRRSDSSAVTTAATPGVREWRPHAEPRSQQASHDGPGMERRRGREEHQHLVLRQHRVAGRVVPARRSHLRRHRRRSRAGHREWRRLVADARSSSRVPDSTYVSDLAASRHADGTVYATFNNHKAGDFKPYVMKSLDFGRTWTSITGNLPERGSAWTIVEDPVRPDLLFVGTEFGVYVTIDGGKSWVQMKGGLPVIPIRDIAIQEREGDLVLATFGRGFYVLDDYTALRTLNADLIAGEATLLPVQKRRSTSLPHSTRDSRATRSSRHPTRRLAPPSPTMWVARRRAGNRSGRKPRRRQSRKTRTSRRRPGRNCAPRIARSHPPSCSR
jgi:photosystem II stability/assembly factor-like uncharacterized protein